MKIVYIPYRRLSVFIPLILLFFNLAGFAQTCDPPTSTSEKVTAATCSSNGVIEVTNVAGNTTGTPQYSLFNQADNVEVKPWQDSNIFNDLPPATYTLHVRYSCVNGFSTVFKKMVTVGGSYINPNILSLTVDKMAQCDNGQITAVAGNGRPPYRYSLVSSQTATEPVAAGDYVRPPQTSQTFSGLAAGTYYVRVYDACNSYVTRNIVVGAYTPPATQVTSLRFTYTLCNSMSAELKFGNLNRYLNTDIRTLTITYPDGSTQTLRAPTSSGQSVFFDVPMEKFGPVDPALNFPDNIGGTWPKAFTVNFTDECGTVHTRTFSYDKPVVTITVNKAANQTTNPDECGSNYVFAALLFVPTSFGQIILSPDAEYRIGDGPWMAVTPTYQPPNYGTQSFTVPFGQNPNICLRACGKEYCIGYDSRTPTFQTTLREFNRTSCAGRSGIGFRSFSSNNGTVAFPVRAHLISGPEGVSIPDFSYTHDVSVSSFAQPEETSDLPLGTYRFLLTDACGRTDEQEITLTRPLPELTANFFYPCGATNISIAIGNNTYNNNTSTIEETLILAQVFKTDGVTSVSNRDAINSADKTITVTSSTPIPNGDYIVKIWRFGAEQCPLEIPWTKTSNFIELSNLMINKNCPGTPTTSTITATANYGTEPYRYSLYRNSYAPENLVVAAQPSNIFNNVEGNGPYLVFAEDACGRGTQGTVSTDVASLSVSNDAGGKMPCPDSDLTLSILNVENATYQWLKDGTEIPGATSNSYTLSGIDNSDAGNYTVRLSIGSCPMLYRGFELDPAECGGSLPVSLTTLTLKKIENEGQVSVRLDWQTTNETGNDRFQVMRSSDSFNWVVLGDVKGRGIDGESFAPLAYHFVDASPLKGRSYYRLKQIDYDKTSTMSPVLSVLLKDDFGLILSPNPVENRLFIQGNINQLKSVTVYNTLGIKVYTFQIDGNGDSFDFTGLPAGVYTVVLVDKNGSKQSRNIVKM